MCDELKTHTDGQRGLCKSHAYQVKLAGGEVALELEPEFLKTCEWPPWPELEPEPDQDSNDSEQVTEV